MQKIRITTKIIIIDNLIILIYIFKFYLNMNILMFFILISIHLYRHFSIYYQLVPSPIASLVLQIYYALCKINTLYNDSIYLPLLCA